MSAEDPSGGAAAHDHAAALRTFLAGATLEALDADPAVLEQMALELVPPDAAPEALDDVIATLEQEADGVTLLAAMAKVGVPPLARRAAAAADRLAQAGAEPTAALAHVGELRLVEAFDVDRDEPLASLSLLCRRPGDERVQAFAFTRADGSEAIEDGLTSQPLDRETLLAEVDESLEGGLRRQPVDPAEALERVTRAARSNVELGVGPTPAGIAVLQLVLRAGEVPDAYLLVEELLALPLMDDDDHDHDHDHDHGHGHGHHDEDHRRNEGLVEGFEAWLARRGDRPEAIEHAAFVAHALGEYRLHEVGGDLVGWRGDELRTFMTEYAPHGLEVEADDIEATPAAVAAYLRYLGETGEVDSDEARALADVAMDAAEDYVAAARRSQERGAGVLLQAMRREGVDLRDQAAVQRWLQAYNALPPEERDRYWPDRPGAAALPPSGAAPPSRRDRAAAKRKRKAARQSRRRNR